MFANKFHPRLILNEQKWPLVEAFLILWRRTWYVLGFDFISVFSDLK